MRVMHVGSWFGPPFDGGRVYRYELIKRLGGQVKQYFVALCDPSDASNASVSALEDLGVAAEGIRVVPKRPIRNLDRLRGLLSPSLPPGVAFLERTVGPALRRVVRLADEEWKPDVTVLWSPNLAGPCRPAISGPALLYACDSMQLVNRSISEQAPCFPVRLYHRWAAWQHERLEQTVFPRYDHVAFISERDLSWSGVRGRVPASVIPAGVDTGRFVPRVEREGENRAVLLFHGFLGYGANVEAVRWLLDSLGPALERRLGREGFELRIVGGGAPESLSALAERRPWARLTGYVDDLAAAVAAADCYVAPLGMGGGMKTKTLEAMACGLPVLGTTEAFSGMEVTPGVHGIILPRERLAEAVIEMVTDPVRRRAIGSAARDWVLRNASWDASAEALAKVLRSLAGTAAGPSRDSRLPIPGAS